MLLVNSDASVWVSSITGLLFTSQETQQTSNTISDKFTETSVQSNYVGFTPKGKIQPEKVKSIDDALAKLIVGKMLPVSIVDNKHFTNFVGMLDPR